jgi:RHH-type rel operon transcriptional repressor/antitoxin RelB
MATSIRLESETEERLNFLASKTGRSKAYYIREIFKNGLDDLEDYYLAEEILGEIRAGKEKLYSSEETRSYLGLDN